MARFGEHVIAADGEIDRSVLGEIVFGDAEARQALNDITHPRIIEILKERIERFRENPPSRLRCSCG